MKTNFYILIIFLLSFSLSNAQSNDIAKGDTPVEFTVNINESDDVEVIDSVELKEVIAKTSDIRKFLNRERNAETIKYVFPDINKRKTA